VDGVVQCRRRAGECSRSNESGLNAEKTVHHLGHERHALGVRRLLRVYYGLSRSIWPGCIASMHIMTACRITTSIAVSMLITIWTSMGIWPMACRGLASQPE
jgi:hypothetical protein